MVSVNAQHYVLFAFVCQYFRDQVFRRSKIKILSAGGSFECDTFLCILRRIILVLHEILNT